MSAPNLDAAATFLELLDPDAEDFVFQCFDDSPLKRRELGKIFYGSLDSMSPYLSRMQEDGAGVFVTINKTRGRKRTIAEVERVRANFADLDGAPLQSVLACALEPHMIVESSPDKYHSYWITEGMALDQFTPVQKAIATRFNSDPVVHDLPRVMRLPGFIHQKGAPFLTKITHLSDRMPYSAERILAEFPPVSQTNGHVHDATVDSTTQAELIRQILTAENYHAALRNLAWRYLVSGMDPKEVKQALHGIMEAAPEPHSERWQARVNDIDRSVETAYRKITALNLTDLTDDGLALALGKDLEPDSRYVAMWGRWMLWDTGVWRADEITQHITRTRKWMRIQAETVTQAHPSMGKAAKKLRDGGTIMSIARLVGTNEELAARTDIWDQNQMLLGGRQTIDLVTGATYEPRQLDYITKRVGVEPAPKGTPHPEWSKFLERATDKNESYKAYLQRATGYWATGSVKDHKFFFVYGGGANGKSTFVETIQAIMGDYACTIGSEMLMVANHDRHPTEVAQLRGMRLAVASEIEEGKMWAEAKIKSLTGGDKISARFMRQDFFTFDPNFKIVVYGNHKPTLRNVDDAIRRRMHMLPFVVKIPEREQDKQLKEKLRAEWPAILRWMMEGCLLWQEFGLKPPELVTAATSEYLAAEDSFEIWRAECTKPGKNEWESSSTLYDSWSRWAVRNGEPPGTQRSFSKKLLDHGFVMQEQGKAKVRGYLGAKVATIADAIAATTGTK